jgi:hypothetical protein
MQDVPQALLLMSGGQMVVLNIGSFDGAHRGVVHAPELPKEHAPSAMGMRPPPSTLTLPDEISDDNSEDPEVHPGPTPTSQLSRGVLGSRDIEEDDFDDENGADQENASPWPAVPSTHSQLEPLAPSTSQHVCS